MIEVIQGRRVHLAQQQERIRHLAGLSEAALKAAPGATVLRDHDRTLVVRLPGETNAPALYWKVFRVAPRWDRAKNLFRPSPAARAWRGSMALQRAGIATAAPAAYGEAGASGAPSFIVTEEIIGAYSLDERLFSHEGSRTRARHALMREIGRLLAQMHSAYLFHKDMRPGNIFIRTAPGERLELLLIDTDRVMHTRLRAWREMRRNLMQVIFCTAPAMTVTDRMRIVKAYGEARGYNRVQTRQLFIDAYRWLRRRLRARVAASSRGIGKKPSENLRRLLERLERLP